MTCIVAVRGKRPVIVADTQHTAGKNRVVALDSKLFEVAGGRLVCGATGSPRVAQVAERVLRGLDPSNFDAKDTDALIRGPVLDAYRDGLVSGGAMETKDGVQAAVCGTALLLCGEDGIWTVFSDFQVLRAGLLYEATGCGFEYALGAMHALATSGIEDAEALAMAGVRAAVRFDVNCGAPYRICVRHGIGWVHATEQS